MKDHCHCPQRHVLSRWADRQSLPPLRPSCDQSLRVNFLSRSAWIFSPYGLPERRVDKKWEMTLVRPKNEKWVFLVLGGECYSLQSKESQEMDENWNWGKRLDRYDTINELTRLDSNHCSNLCCLSEKVVTRRQLSYSFRFSTQVVSRPNANVLCDFTHHNITHIIIFSSPRKIDRHVRHLFSTYKIHTTYAYASEPSETYTFQTAVCFPPFLLFGKSFECSKFGAGTNYHPSLLVMYNFSWRNTLLQLLTLLASRDDYHVVALHFFWNFLTEHPSKHATKERKSAGSLGNKLQQVRSQSINQSNNQIFHITPRVPYKRSRHHIAHSMHNWEGSRSSTSLHKNLR